MTRETIQAIRDLVEIKARVRVNGEDCVVIRKDDWDEVLATLSGLWSDSLARKFADSLDACIKGQIPPSVKGRWQDD